MKFMERSPNDDRSGTLNRGNRRNQDAREHRADQVNPSQQTPGGAAQQQQQPSSPRARDFAPGEDGECH
jgi:hypothetical protein